MLTVVGNTAWDTWVSVRKMPRTGGSRRGRYLGEGPGGTASNSAAQAAALGTPVTLIVPLGEDEIGHRMRSIIQASGVELIATPASRTTQVTVYVDQDGERTMVIFDPQGPNPAGGPPSLSSDVAWIDVPSPSDRAVWAGRCDGLRGLPLHHVEEELERGGRWSFIVGSLSDHPAPSSEQLQQLGCDWCIATDGARGGQLWTVASPHWQTFRTMPVPRDQVIDVTGAGDCFLGGLLAGLSGQLPLSKAIALGCEAGANAVRRRGAWPGAMPDQQPADGPGSGSPSAIS